MLKTAFYILPVLFGVVVQAETLSLSDYLDTYCDRCVTDKTSQSGLYVLEKGEEALMSRAWLAGRANKSIDVQYFIWSTDNIGILAVENLLSAAERGVKVRVLVDDLLIDAKDEHLIGLNAHPNISIKLYNPKHSVGVSRWEKYWYLLTDFRSSNQRMHDKTAIFDGMAGITGGRNMADEYFDYDQKYNFRDRDVLVIGRAVDDMQDNFNRFWNSDLSVAVDTILDCDGERRKTLDLDNYYQQLQAYAGDPKNFEPEVREALDKLTDVVPGIVTAMRWTEARFISDSPGKNPGTAGLGGGGDSTRALIEVLKNAEKSVLIQSPYLVMPKGGFELFAGLIERGVEVTVSTNSLAATDNLYAFSGYHKQRARLLRAGIRIHEYMPEPAVRTELIRRYQRLEKNKPVFAVHAKTMVIDDELLYIGTFNLDPRSANLNTEVGILVRDPELAEQVLRAIALDIQPDNSWRVTELFNPDNKAPFVKRLKVFGFGLLPLEPLL
jgi:putative cardiolipin synthase